MIDLALEYARQGWPIFPLVPGGKLPAISRAAGGHGCLDATTETAIIEMWWTKIPNANIGLATGPRSNLLVIDIDPRRADTWLQSLRGLALPQSFTVRTWSGGWHIYLACQDPCVTIGADLLPGIDWRGRGGYVVAAGSIVDGKVYTIARKGEIATAPPVLIDRILAKKGNRIIQGDEHGDMIIPAGERNDRLFRIGCALRRFGVGYNAIVETLRAVNADHCLPALDDEEIRKIAASAVRYQPADRGAA